MQLVLTWMFQDDESVCSVLNTHSQKFAEMFCEHLQMSYGSLKFRRSKWYHMVAVVVLKARSGFIV